MIIGISGKIGSGKDTVAQMIQFLDMQEKMSMPDWKYKDNPELWHESIGKHHKHTWKIKRFADTLKDITCMLIGCTREHLEDREFKEQPLEEEWKCWEVNYDIDHPAGFSEQWEQTKIFLTKNEAIDWAEDNRLRYSIDKRQLTPRKLMQLLGTEAGREIIHPNIWVNALFADYTPLGSQHFSDNPDKDSWVYPKWIIPDTRFTNEAKAIRDRDGILIRINRGVPKLPELKDVWTYEHGKVEPIYLGEQDSNDPLPEFRTKEEAERYANSQGHPSEIALDKWEDWDYVIENDGTLEDLLIKVKEIYAEI